MNRQLQSGVLLAKMWKVHGSPPQRLLTHGEEGSLKDGYQQDAGDRNEDRRVL